ncbi:spore coat protein U domain-containing protein [Ramlibacter ginsenosidimutans]|uniref:Spore coat protein U domain-containing protein n=1 Tax=Ramlibacter ginsenosidimutans TaxID=502333 RepID=A0A934TQ80_9BURK|nr:spore coat protein U domain-containing protein [Ramlibacter ginsenosidimutans]MBK6005280.1 spore coat protein U domain-containing protein [Ramlibacter ginsenosidimutans]
MSKILHRLLLGAAALLCSMPGWSAITCSTAVNPSSVNLIYNNTSVSAQGTVDITCMRDPSVDPSHQTFWIGMTQTPAGRNAPLDVDATKTINYVVYHSTTTRGVWTEAGSAAAGSTANGAIVDKQNFHAGSTLSLSYTFTLNIPAGQAPKPAGVYLDTVPITVRDTDGAGAILSTASFNVYISIPRSCRFSTPPSGINVNYTAFSPTAVTGSSSFAITCTQGTTYTIALDQARSVVPTVGLAYGLSLTASGINTGTALAQPYSVNISVDAKQPGSCNVSTCSGTDTRTLTVSY